MEHPSFFGLPPGEPIPGKTYRADGWIYASLPFMPLSVWEELQDVLGKEMVPLALNVRTLEDQRKIVRGQVLVSPYGMETVLPQYQARKKS